MARVWETARYDTRIGPNVRDQVVDQVRDQAERNISCLLGTVPKHALLDGPRSVADSVGAEIVQVVTRAARRASPNMSARMSHVLATLVRLRRPSRNWAGYSRSSISPFELGWVWPCWFLHECCDLQSETEQFRGHWLICANTGWMLPHQQTCWLSERPTVLSYDARGRLHGARGPALAYPDGWSNYAWKGIEVPAALIEQPQTITLASIDREPDAIVRRTMIEIITPARFVAIGGAVRAGQDETGVLWRKTWWTGDSWAAVEVVNGTPQTDETRQHYFLQVPPELRTPRAAVAWTYGLREDQYNGLVQRT